MRADKIEFENFRNITKAEIRFSDGVNVLVGDNAEGKTNAVEGLYVCALSKSFRAQHEKELIRFGCDHAKVSLDYTDSVRSQNLTVSYYENAVRKIERNAVKIEKYSDAVGLFKAVLFCPEHLSLIKDGPSARRYFVNTAISQLRPVYIAELQTHNRVLLQRNKLLKYAAENRNDAGAAAYFRSSVKDWSEQLAVSAAKLSVARAGYISELSEFASVCFRDMTSGSEKPRFIYRPSVSVKEDDMVFDEKYMYSRYLEMLTSRLDRELDFGSTLYGVHKDDIEILLNDRPARLFASQGQQRSLSLAAKLAEGDIAYRECGEHPVYLFDDVLSELDAKRRAYLLGELGGRQVIITTCSAEGLPESSNIIKVKNGSYFQ